MTDFELWRALHEMTQDIELWLHTPQEECEVDALDFIVSLNRRVEHLRDALVEQIDNVTPLFNTERKTEQ